MSQRPLIISLQVKTQILLTTVAGQSSMASYRSGSIKIGGHHDSHQLHPWIEPTPRNDKGLAFTDSHHPQTHNYRPACARTSLAAPRRPSLVV
jgi:hypothetical protein